MRKKSISIFIIVIILSTSFNLSLLAEPVIAAPSATSTFYRALPYGACSLSMGVAGAFLSLAATATAVKVMGIVMGVMGTYAFMATLVCGIISKDANEFDANISKYVISGIGAGLSDIIRTVVHNGINHMIQQCLYGRN